MRKSSAGSPIPLALSPAPDHRPLQDGFGRLHEIFTRIIMASYQYDLISRCESYYTSELIQFREQLKSRPDADKLPADLPQKIGLAIAAIQKLIKDLKPAVKQLEPLQAMITGNPVYQAVVKAMTQGGRALMSDREDFESYLLLAESIISHPIYGKALLKAMSFILVHQHHLSDVNVSLLPVLDDLKTHDTKAADKIKQHNNHITKHYYYSKIAPLNDTPGESSLARSSSDPSPKPTESPALSVSAKLLYPITMPITKLHEAFSKIPLFSSKTQDQKAAPDNVLATLPLPDGASDDAVGFIKEPLGFSPRFYSIVKLCLQDCCKALGSIAHPNPDISDYHRRALHLEEKMDVIVKDAVRLIPPDNPEQGLRGFIQLYDENKAKAKKMEQMERKMAELERQLALLQGVSPSPDRKSLTVARTTTPERSLSNSSRTAASPPQEASTSQEAKASTLSVSPYLSLPSPFVSGLNYIVLACREFRSNQPAGNVAAFAFLVGEGFIAVQMKHQHTTTLSLWKPASNRQGEIAASWTQVQGSTVDLAFLGLPEEMLMRFK